MKTPKILGFSLFCLVFLFSLSTFFLFPNILENARHRDGDQLSIFKSFTKDDTDKMILRGVKRFSKYSTQAKIAKKLRYFESPLELKESCEDIKGSGISNRYITFEDDTGGWNNIRLAFEVFVSIAWLTGRTLVVPPRARFYLLDRGPITVFDKKAHDTSSTYSDYYNFGVLGEEIRIISTEEFLKESEVSQLMPSKVRNEVESVIDGSLRPFGNGHHTEYFLWLREASFVEMWPSGPKLNEDFNPLLPNLKEQTKVLHFPMHVSKNLRFLSGASHLVDQLHNSVASDCVKNFIREKVTYRDFIFRKAATLVTKIGGSKGYSAGHIRRNELQYKNVFIGGSKSLENIREVLKPNETIYLATDETEPDFFRAFEEQGYTLVRLSDLKESFPEEFVGFLPKYEGMLEQLICAMGREFFGTPSSTFSSYILRLRGYILGVKHECRFHTKVQKKGSRGDCGSHFSGDMNMWRLDSA